MKKIISLILAICVIMSSFGVFASDIFLDVELDSNEIIDSIFKFDVGDFISSMTPEDMSSDPDLKRIGFLDAIGVWDDVSKSKDSLVSMTELGIIMSRVRLGSVNSLEGVYTIEENVDKTNATYYDAYRGLISALGYEYRYREFGNEEQAILIVAADIGLIPQKPDNANAYITRNELSKLVTKALTIDLCTMEYTKNGGYKYVVTEGRNLLNNVHSIYDVSGFVNAIPGISVYGGASVRDGFIQIDRRNVADSGLDLNKYFGSYVNAYAYFDEVTKTYSVVYIDYAENNVGIEVDFSQIVQIKNGIVSYEENGEEKEISADTLEYITENGKTLGSLSEMQDYTNCDGKIVFASTYKNGDINVAMIYRYVYSTIAYNDLIDNRIGFKFAQEYEGKNYIQLGDKDVIRVYEFDLPVEYTELKPNTAFKALVTDGYIEIHTSTTKVTGDVEILDGDRVTINGKQYRISKSFLNYIDECMTPGNDISSMDKVSPIEVGMKGTFYIIDGVITGYEASNEYIFGWLKSVSLSRTSIDPKLSVRIFSSNSDWIDAPVAEKIELDGVAGIKQEKLLSTIQNNPEIVEELVRFKLNSNGELSGLDTIIESANEEDDVTDVKHEYQFTGDLDHTLYFLGINVPYFLGQSAPVFIIPENREKESNYKVYSTASLPTGGITLDLYCADDFLQCKAIVWHGGSVAQTTETVMHIESIRRVVIDADNMEYGYRIIGKDFKNLRSRASGKLVDVSFYVKEEIFEANPVSVGDFINYVANGEYLISWIIDYPGGIVPDTDSEIECNNQGSKYYKIVGTVKRVDVANDLVVLEYNGKETVIIPRAKGIIDTTRNVSTEVSLSDFHSGDRVCFTTSSGHGSYMFKNPAAE